MCYGTYYSEYDIGSNGVVGICVRKSLQRHLDAHVQPDRKDPSKAANDSAFNGVEYVLLIRINDLLVPYAKL